MLVGAERRTLKLLLGVANGAWLLKPEWITDSLEKASVEVQIQWFSMHDERMKFDYMVAKGSRFWLRRVSLGSLLCTVGAE